MWKSAGIAGALAVALCLTACGSATPTTAGADEDAFACGVTSTYAIDAATQTTGWLDGTRDARDALKALDAVSARVTAERSTARTDTYRAALERIGDWAGGAYDGVRNYRLDAEQLRSSSITAAWQDVSRTCDGLKALTKSP